MLEMFKSSKKPREPNELATGCPLLVEASYFAAALLFILGIKRMASPVTARSGIQWAGVGMLLATVATFFYRARTAAACTTSA